MVLRSRSTVLPAPYVATPSQQWDGNDGYWSTFHINVGTPGQDFRILPSTAGSETWVPLPDACTSTAPSNCAQLRGVENFDSAASSGFSKNRSSTWSEIGTYTVDLETALGYSVNGYYGYDNVSIGATTDSDTLSLGHQVVAGIGSTDFFLGLLGLNVRPITFSSNSPTSTSFMTNAYKEKKIPSLSYGYTAGARYKAKGVFGSLTLGGYDSSRFTPSSLSFSFSSQDARALTVGVQSMVATNTLLGVASFTASPASTFYAVVDSSVPHLWLPGPTCDLIANAFGLLFDNATQLYYVNDTTHAKLQALNPSINFKLSNSILDTGSANSTNIAMSYSAFDLKISWPYLEANSSQTVNYFPMRRAANDSQYTLGRAFLQETYLIVDHHRRNFSLNQATFSDPTPSPQIVTIHPTGDKSGSSSGSSLSTGAIVGIAVGGAALLAIILLLAFLFLRRRRKAKSAELDGTGKHTATEDKDQIPGASESGGTQIQELYSPNYVSFAAKRTAAANAAAANGRGGTGYAPVAQELDSGQMYYELSGEPGMQRQEMEGSPLPPGTPSGVGSGTGTGISYVSDGKGGLTYAQR